MRPSCATSRPLPSPGDRDCCWTSSGNAQPPPLDSSLTSLVGPRVSLLLLPGCLSPDVSLLGSSSGLDPLVKRDFVAKLPHELATRILSFLDARTLARICRVSRAWNRVTNDDLLWRVLCRRGSVFEGKGPSSVPREDHHPQQDTVGRWKRLYINEDTLRRNWGRGQCEPVTLRGHTRSVFAVCLQGDICVSASYDRTVKVWDLRTAACLRTLEGHSQGVTSVLILGQQVVSSSSDRTIRFWDLETGSHLRTLTGHMGEVCSISADGQVLVSGSCDRTVRVWDLQSGTERLELTGHQDYIIAVHVKNGLIASASYDTTVRLWRLEDASCVRTLAGHTL